MYIVVRKVFFNLGIPIYLFAGGIEGSIEGARGIIRPIVDPTTTGLPLPYCFTLPLLMTMLRCGRGLDNWFTTPCCVSAAAAAAYSPARARSHLFRLANQDYNKMKASLAVTVLAAVLSCTSTAEARGNTGTRRRTREQMVNDLIDRQAMRQQKLEEMIVERKRQLEDHEAGRSLLSADDHERVKRQIQNFGKKLDTMNRMTDRDRDEMIQREMEMMQEINARAGAHKRKLEL